MIISKKIHHSLLHKCLLTREHIHLITSYIQALNIKKSLTQHMSFEYITRNGSRQENNNNLVTVYILNDNALCLHGN